LKSLINFFEKVHGLTDYNYIYIVEKVRNLTEFLVYGEQYKT